LAGFWTKTVQAIRGTTREAPQAGEAPPRPKAYPVGVVGERNYQQAIRRCREGEPVTLIREPSNPFDGRAIAVVCARGRTIGYIPKDSFIQRAVWDDGKGCQATIRSVGSGEAKLLGVVLDVGLCPEPLGERDFSRE